MNEFAAHWGLVDTALGAPLIVSPDSKTSVSRVNFGTLKANLGMANDELVDHFKHQEIARGDINLRKAKLLEHLREFTQLMSAYYAATAFYNAVPKLPNLTDGQERFYAPLRDANSSWKKINVAAAPPGVTLSLALSDGMVQLVFEDALKQLNQAYDSEANAAQSVTVSRATRDKIKAEAYEVMKAYRQAVPPRCGQHPELVDTLPALTPAPGHTPEPVNASAVFQAPDQAKVAYDASADADLARYELRSNPGDAYQDEDAVVIATNDPADPREFITSFALTQPGAQVALKVYVVLNSGNEAGSATMVVHRPL